MLEDQNSPNNASSIEGLEQQLLAVAADSPSSKKAKEFQFDSRDDSFVVADSQNADEEDENKMYDILISKVLSNPRIDKRTLLQKFISKIELESNMNNIGLASELSQIKKMMSNESTTEVPTEHLISNNDPK